MRTFSHNYESDITREQFEPIRPEPEGARKKTKPGEIDLRSVFCAILYLVKGGIQWRMLPGDFPKRGIVRHYHDVWSEKKKDGGTALTGVLKKIDCSAAGGWIPQGKADARADRRAEREERLLREREGQGYDAGKKTGGIKRRIVVDTMGLLHGFLVTADETDQNGATEMVALHLDGLSQVRKHVVDGGYSGENFAAAIRELAGAEVQVVKRSEVGKFAVLPQRWIVERSFGWLNHARRLWKNCERALHNSCQMMVLAFISVYLRGF